MLLIFEGNLDAFKLNRFQQNFKLSLLRAYADHSSTPAPVRNVHKHHRLQQQLQQCHQSLRVILMLSKPTDFNQILNLASSGLMQTIQIMTKGTKPGKNVPRQSNEKKPNPQPKPYFKQVFWRQYKTP